VSASRGHALAPSQPQPDAPVAEAAPPREPEKPKTVAKATAPKPAAAKPETDAAPEKPKKSGGVLASIVGAVFRKKRGKT
jgi:hypothetical protein